MRAADLFCGAGGSTTGAESAGVKVVLAVNHWRTAIQSHSANHPGTRHICARIDDIDPRNDDLPRFDILMASPECTHHSIARGGMPVEDQKRATPWHVCVWAEAMRPKWIIVENVREFRDWGPIHNGRPIKSRKGETFAAWLNALRSLGYSVDHRLLNAADFGEATKRIRLFVVARRGAGVIRWPEPTHAGNWRAAAEIIDWGRPCPSIFGRKRPLADKTLRRIEMGLRKFVRSDNPWIVKFRSGDLHEFGESVLDPMSTMTAGGSHHGLAVPFQFKAMGRNPGATKSIDTPLPTIVATRENHSIVVPYLVPNFGERNGQPPRSHGVGEPLPAVTSHGAGQLVMPFVVKTSNTGTTGRAQYQYDPTEPLRTVTTRQEFGVAAPFLMKVNHGDDGQDRCYPVDEPIRVVTTKLGESLVLPFLTEYYGTGGARSVEEPVSTVTTKHRHGLAMVELLRTMQELEVADIGFRMLDVDELAAAQGFPDGYQLFGTKADQIRQVGNAVCPGVMRAICSTIKGAA